MSTIISGYASQICDYAGFSTRVKQSDLEIRLANTLSGMRSEGLLSGSEWAGLDAVWYGLHWYVQTGRATAEIESELRSLSGRQMVRLIVKIWADGCNVSGDVGNWLRKWQGAYARLIK